MSNKDSPRNEFQGLTVEAKVTAAYSDYCVTNANLPSGQTKSVTFSRKFWPETEPWPKSGEVVSLARIRLLDQGYRSYLPRPKA